MAVIKIIFCQIFLLIYDLKSTASSSHWVVTENGKVEAQMDSVFILRRPYDLVSLMNQEERHETVEKLKNELIVSQEVIDRNEDKEVGLEHKFYKTNPHCKAAGKPLPEFDLYISTVLPLENKGIKPEDSIPILKAIKEPFEPPVCTNLVDLPYSVHCFEHLEGMKQRNNLSGTPEIGLKPVLTDDVEHYGALVNTALTKNTTSWVLYNMAAFYWRIKGDSYNAVECLRRALHFSPRQHKDIALISLSNILHRAHYSDEATTVVQAALDISNLNVNHFTLGNIYAVLGNYNLSVKSYENTLKLQPDFEAAARRRHAVLCHSQLERALEAQHRSLQRTLEDLKEYQDKHDIFQKHQEKLMDDQAPLEMKVDQTIGYENFKIKNRYYNADIHYVLARVV